MRESLAQLLGGGGLCAGEPGLDRHLPNAARKFNLGVSKNSLSAGRERRQRDSEGMKRERVRGKSAAKGFLHNNNPFFFFFSQAACFQRHWFEPKVLLHALLKASNRQHRLINRNEDRHPRSRGAAHS